jgi:hypothetical protein
MPVYSGFDREIVRHKNLEGVVLVGFNERARMLAVDQINRAGESICKAVNHGHQPFGYVYEPGAASPSWTVKL